uniref:G_PROTEIN_RECEP_F1_2 domain-containing protein n=1 Tax=Macrostomum lignano TaxID=282301 RepID=A0A1I8FI18_9PLAT
APVVLGPAFGSTACHAVVVANSARAGRESSRVRSGWLAVGVRQQVAGELWLWRCTGPRTEWRSWPATAAGQEASGPSISRLPVHGLLQSLWGRPELRPEGVAAEALVAILHAEVTENFPHSRILLAAFGVFVFMGLATLGYGIYLAPPPPRLICKTWRDSRSTGFTAIFNGLIIIMLRGAVVMRDLLILVVTVTSTSHSLSPPRKISNDRLSNAQCCGFSGDPSDNLFFLKTPWFKKVNANPSNKTLKERRLPDSCCLVAGPKCRESESLKEAREKKYVFEDSLCIRIDGEVAADPPQAHQRPSDERPITKYVYP